MPGRARFLNPAAAIALLVGLHASWSPPASAQPGPLGASPGEVEIAVGEFGVGGVARAGDWTGLRLELTDRTDAPRDAVVRLRLPDPDGDIAMIQRTVTLNPGRTQSVWLYTRTPFSLDPGSVYTVTVREATRTGDEFVAGRQIGAARIGPMQVVGANLGAAMIGLIGRDTMGLDQYETLAPGRDYAATAHEPVRLVPDLTPLGMPDAWMGLAPFESVVWTEEDPAQLRLDQAEAIQAWIRRGGHLVVVLPSIGQAWTNERSNRLFDLMPEARVIRREGVDLNRHQPLLTAGRDLPLPQDAVVHTFRPDPGASVNEAAEVLNGPGGQCIAIRRLVGAGAVTLIGIDLTDRGLLGRLDAQSFWHRILGERFEALSRAEASAIQSSGQGNFLRVGPVWLDGDIASLINKTGRAGAGVLLGLIVFIAYFLLAGPLGYALLAQQGWKRHAWLAFVGVAACFTVIAWGGATAIKPRQVDVTHVTLLDHVYEEPLERARTWFSVLLPTYGAQTVGIGDPNALAASERRQALSPWGAPDGVSAGFPDRREYVISARRPDSIAVPTRSTVKQFQADWLGAPRWTMPQPRGGEIVATPSGGLQGVLRHDLPAALERVTIVHVRRQRPLGPLPDGGPLLADALAWKRSGDWPPGEAFDLATLSTAAGADDSASRAESYFERLASAAQPRGLGTGLNTALDPGDAPTRLEALSFHSMLEPPEFRGTVAQRESLLGRRAAHSWGLGRWFTQPCVIIVGQLADAPAPTPITVDGESPPSRGRTVVRWIYPLPADPPRAQSSLEAG